LNRSADEFLLYPPKDARRYFARNGDDALRMLLATGAIGMGGFFLGSFYGTDELTQWMEEDGADIDLWVESADCKPFPIHDPARRPEFVNSVYPLEDLYDTIQPWQHWHPVMNVAIQLLRNFQTEDIRLRGGAYNRYSRPNRLSKAVEMSNPGLNVYMRPAYNEFNASFDPSNENFTEQFPRSHNFKSEIGIAGTYRFSNHRVTIQIHVVNSETKLRVMRGKNVPLAEYLQHLFDINLCSAICFDKNGCRVTRHSVWPYLKRRIARLTTFCLVGNDITDFKSERSRTRLTHDYSSVIIHTDTTTARSYVTWIALCIAMVRRILKNPTPYDDRDNFQPLWKYIRPTRILYNTLKTVTSTLQVSRIEKYELRGLIFIEAAQQYERRLGLIDYKRINVHGEEVDEDSDDEEAKSDSDNEKFNVEVADFTEAVKWIYQRVSEMTEDAVFPEYHIARSTQRLQRTIAWIQLLIAERMDMDVEEALSSLHYLDPLSRAELEPSF
jgi:hypothetical protein